MIVCTNYRPIKYTSLCKSLSVLSHSVYHPAEKGTWTRFIIRMYVCIRICTSNYSLAFLKAPPSGLHIYALRSIPLAFFLGRLFSMTNQTEACSPYPQPQSQGYSYNPAAYTKTNPTAPCQSLHMPLFSSTLPH